MIRRVEITRLAAKQLRKLPQHIVGNLMIWVEGRHGRARGGRGSQQARVLTEVPMPMPMPKAKAKAKKSDAMKTLEKIAGGPLTLARAIESIRKGQELSQDECAKKLGVSKSHLCDVEKGRKVVSPERAAKWARVLGYPESVLVKLAIQGELDAAGLKYKVEIVAA
jgi:DNA-binding transcriptional regulator YiaG